MRQYPELIKSENNKKKGPRIELQKKSHINQILYTKFTNNQVATEIHEQKQL